MIASPRPARPISRPLRLPAITFSAVGLGRHRPSLTASADGDCQSRFANDWNRANADLSVKLVGPHADSRAIRNPWHSLRLCVSPCPTDTTNTSRHGAGQMHGLTFAALRLCVSPCPAPRIRRMPHAGMEDLTPRRRGNACPYLCGFAPLREAFPQSWHECLTPRRRKISRQGAKPQRKCMVLLLASLAPLREPPRAIRGSRRRPWSGLDPARSLLAQPSLAEIPPPIDNAPDLPPRPRLPHLPTLPNQPVRTSAERHGGHPRNRLMRDSVTAVKASEG